MPLKTFFNLDKQRRKEIVDVSIKEFAFNNYQSASLGNIIKQLGVARGSFYRYFEGKNDLYNYLVNECFSVIENLNEKYIKQNNVDFFKSWLMYGIRIIKEEINHPFYLAFLSRVTHENYAIKLNKDLRDRENQRINVFKEMIRFHVETGQLRKDISIEIQTMFLLNVRESIRQFLISKYDLQFSSKDYINNDFFGLNDEEIYMELKEFSILLREALKSPDW